MFAILKKLIVWGAYSLLVGLLLAGAVHRTQTIIRQESATRGDWNGEQRASDTEVSEPEPIPDSPSLDADGEMPAESGLFSSPNGASLELDSPPQQRTRRGRRR